MFSDTSDGEEGAPATVHSPLLASGGIGRDLNNNTYVTILDHYVKLRPPAMFYDLELPYDSGAEIFKLQTPLSSEWNFPKMCSVRKASTFKAFQCRGSGKPIAQSGCSIFPSNSAREEVDFTVQWHFVTQGSNPYFTIYRCRRFPSLSGEQAWCYAYVPNVTSGSVMTGGAFPAQLIQAARPLLKPQGNTMLRQTKGQTWIDVTTEFAISEGLTAASITKLAGRDVLSWWGSTFMHALREACNSDYCKGSGVRLCTPFLAMSVLDGTVLLDVTSVPNPEAEGYRDYDHIISLIPISGSTSLENLHG
ncbi:hypothetical protein BKA83DRAFT_4125808 [Pisolithus microcarpus]|nr:hypothetical protein BKA83DRAFT_4125808 [Pisolithus microcarpus]